MPMGRIPRFSPSFSAGEAAAAARALLRPGDEVLYEPVERGAFDRLIADPNGGAVAEALL